MRTAQPTRAVRAVIACLALALATLVVPLGATADASDRPDPPRVLVYGITAGGYASIVWAPDSAVDGVNVYRNRQYIATVRGGTVYNDFSPGISPSYELVAFKGDAFSSKTDRFYAGGYHGNLFQARVELAAADQAVTIRWSLWGPNLSRYEIYRLDSGAPVRWGQGTRIGWGRMQTRPGSQVFVDTAPRRGASYGIRVIRADGTSMPMMTVKPEYSRPVIPLTARCSAFNAGCGRPFEPIGDFGTSGISGDRVEVIPVDPSLPDPNSPLFDPGGLGFIPSPASNALLSPTDSPSLEVPLNELTDPDNDGLSVFSDDDNDNDGVPTSQDQDDTNPSVGRPSSGNGNGNGNGDGDGDGGGWAPGYSPANPGGDEPGTPF